MSKFLPTIALLIIISFGVFSRTYTPFPTSNALWNCSYTQSYYAAPDNNGVDNYVTSYLTNGDTIINSIIYTQVISNTYFYSYYFYPSYSVQNSSIGVFSYIGCFRNDSINKLVYFFPKDSLIEYILYDFNLSIGDTIAPDWYNKFNSGTGGPVVYSVDSIFLNGAYHRRVSLSNYIDLIEGVGPTSGFLNPFNSCLECNVNLNCFEVNHISIYPVNSTICGPVSIQKNDLVSFTASPNPTNGKFLIKGPIENCSMKILNMLGECVFESSNIETGREVDISNCKTGIYLCKITSNISVFDFKIIRN
jgi:hypothetical protein